MYQLRAAFCICEMTAIVASEAATLGFHRIEDYEQFIGSAAVERIQKKGERLRGVRLAHISSTFYGGGVAEILTPLTLLFNAMGLETGWQLIQGTPDFFNCTKKIHNALQGDATGLDPNEKAIYEQVIFENSVRLQIEPDDLVVIHDPQPLPLVRHLRRGPVPWIWQCHIDLTEPNSSVWRYLSGFVQQFDAAIFSLEEYGQNLSVPQHFFMPAINPFSAKNRDMTEEEINASLGQHQIPTERPLIVQISRFDRWKDPTGVIEAFRMVQREIDCTLVLLGNNASDDPEGQVLLETILSSADERINVISVDDPTLVNALQRRADVVLQKSIREGFGLTVAEAMWKGAAVVGGNVGGIRRQIQDGTNGFLVDSVEQTAERILSLLRDEILRKRLGANARETVRTRFLLSRLAEDWVDFISAIGR
jgi:trehalose synthase